MVITRELSELARLANRAVELTMPHTITGLVSTIIPVHDRPRLLREAVESVFAQTYRPIEILISDDGSSDETPEVARSLERDYPGEVRLLTNPNRGPGPAREAARQLARGEFIQYLDSDDRLLPNKFEVQVKALREQPECGVAYGFVRLTSGDGTSSSRPFKWTGRGLGSLFPWLLVDRWWTTECPLYRRSVCDAVGAWSDLRYSQDWEYDARVGALGTRLAHCAEFVCEHRTHGGPRQTGHGGWLEPAARLRFFESLHRSAVTAGVASDSPEMAHFARWIFFHARECGRLGDAAAARACLNLATRAAGAPTPHDMRLYRWAAHGLGWRWSGRLAGWADSVRRGPGPRTLRQSWLP